MVRTKEGLFAEMATAMVVAALIPELEKAAPESAMLRELREAMRVAHPACFDEKANPDLHAEFKAGIGRDAQGVLANLRLPASPIREPERADHATSQPPSSGTVGAAVAGAAAAAGPAAQQFTPEETELLRKLLAKAAPPVVPGDETTARVE